LDDDAQNIVETTAQDDENVKVGALISSLEL
jgi:hypothetical protein